MKDCKWEEVLKSRGQSFAHMWNNFLQLQTWRPVAPQNVCWAVVQVAHVPVPGLNSVVHALLRCAQSTPVQTVYGVHNGLQGLQDNHMTALSWESVINYTNACGSSIGCQNTSMPSNSAISLDRIEATITARGINSLLVVGDNRALELVRALGGDQREALRRLNVVIVPGAVSPAGGLEAHCWLGYDSLLNRACDVVTQIRLSNLGTSNRLFLVDTDLHMATLDFITPGLFALSNGINFVYPVGKEQLMGKDGEMFQAEKVKQEAELLRSSMEKSCKNSMVLA